MMNRHTEDYGRPLLVWLDDELADTLTDVFEPFADDLRALGVFFDVAVFKNTDEAVQFIVENGDRVFLFAQDSFR